MAFLESLRFPSMGDRESAVVKAHQKTFEWIFEDSSSDFVELLKAGTDTFWIQGKAGSGKSTLIRFITTHSKIGEYLDS
jgi:ABC-type lipoprotein export system ATPase subunit